MTASSALRIAVLVALLSAGLGAPAFAATEGTQAIVAPDSAAPESSQLDSGSAALAATAAKTTSDVAEQAPALPRQRPMKSNVFQPMLLGLMSGAVLALVVYAWGRLTMKKDTSGAESAAR